LYGDGNKDLLYRGACDGDGARSKRRWFTLLGFFKVADISWCSEMLVAIIFKDWKS
jgi:hypothetical protein